MNIASQKRLTKIHPLLAERVRDLEKNLLARSIPIECVQGLRTFAEQDALYAQGRTKPGQRVTNARGGQSNHNYGLAVDLAPVKNGKIDWNAWAEFGAIGEEARKLGLEWGGDWKKFVDKPHVQLPSPPIATLKKLYDKGGLPEVWKKANSVKVKTEPEESDPFVVSASAVASFVPVELVTPEETAKGVTTSEKPASETEGTPPPAPAAEVKASQVSLFTKLGSLSLPAGVMTVLAAIGKFVQSLPPWAWVAIVVGAMLVGYLIWRDSQRRAHERTLRVMHAAASKTENNLRLV